MRDHLPPIAVALRKARAASGLSQHRLADLSGVARQTIANIELGVHASVRLKTLQQLAATLQCDIRDLMGDPAEEDLGLEVFLRSPLARSLKLGADEIRWLRQARVSWQQAAPTDLSWVHLVYAKRAAG